MLKIKRKRVQSLPSRATKFRLRDEDVADSKLERWETRMQKAGKINESDTFSEIGE